MLSCQAKKTKQSDVQNVNKPLFIFLLGFFL